MRLLSIDNVKEGMRLAKNIYSADGNILLAKDIIINSFYIQRLKELQISSLYITDERIGQIEVDELVKIQTRIDATRITKDAMANVREGKTLNGAKVRQAVNDVMEELLNNRNIVFNLVDVRAMNDYHFSHNVTVCVLSVMAGIAVGYNYSKLKELGTGAILHDIGKANIPEFILNKSSQLSREEYQEIKQHPQVGFEVLRKSDNISSVSAQVAWQHHERFDGSGYPRGIKGNEIHEYARIVTLADVYDAMSTDRIYRERLLPHVVIEYIRDKSRTLFDPDLAKIFLQNIAPFPIGSVVLLNNGEKGVVVKVSRNIPARPVVKIIYDQAGNMLSQPFDRDLSKDLTLIITEIEKE